MATKPTSEFTFSTDANFSSGPASGQPTKVAPAGWPANLQGFVPGLEYASEFRNWLFNVLGDWTQWLASGSAAGAENAHIIEAGSLGETSIYRVHHKRVVRDVVNIDASVSGPIRDNREGYAFRFDNSSATGPTTMTIGATGSPRPENGEEILISFLVQHGTHVVSIASENGGANPIYSSDPTPTLGPDWVLLQFDQSQTGSEPNGEWIVVAHGSVG